MNFKEAQINVETFIHDNDEINKNFYDYLDEYSISYKKIKELDNNCYLIEYKGGPVSLSNMLTERFGMSKDEIISSYPEIINT